MANLYLFGHGITSVSVSRRKVDNKEVILSLGKLLEQKEVGEDLSGKTVQLDPKDLTHIVFANIEGFEVFKNAVDEVHRLLIEREESKQQKTV